MDDIKNALDLLGYADFTKRSVIPHIDPKICSAPNVLHLVKPVVQSAIKKVNKKF